MVLYRSVMSSKLRLTINNIIVSGMWSDGKSFARSTPIRSITLSEGDTFNLSYKLDFEKDSHKMSTQTFQDFIKNNPDITLEDAFFEMFKFYPELTVNELEAKFKEELNQYFGIKKKEAK